MTIENIALALEVHSVPYYIENDRVYADTMDAAKAALEEVVDLTDYTHSQLYAWLGY